MPSWTILDRYGRIKGTGSSPPPPPPSPPPPATPTLAHTLDSLLFGSRTLVHSLDTLLLGSPVASNQIDTLLGGPTSLHNNIDTLLRATFTGNHTIDSLLLATLARTNTIDTLLTGPGSLHNNIDTLLSGSPEATHGIDTYLSSAPPDFWTVPGTQSGDDQTELTISGISYGETPTSNTVEVTLTARSSQGMITILSDSGLTFTEGQVGIPYNTMTFSGTVANVNGALETVRYAPTTHGTLTHHLDLTAHGTDTASIEIDLAEMTLGSIALNGTDQRGGANFASGPGAANFNIIVWCNFVSLPTNSSPYAAQRESCGQLGFQMYGSIDMGGGLDGAYANVSQTSVNKEIGTSAHIGTGTWRQMMLERDGNNLYLFMDGTQIGTVATAAGGIDATGSSIQLGTESCGSFSHGSFAGFCIRRRALTVGEKALTLSHPYLLWGSDVQAFWRLNDGSGTSAVDSSGNAHDMTLVNTPSWDSSHP